MARRRNIWLPNSSIKPILGCRPGGNSLILSPKTWVPISLGPRIMLTFPFPSSLLFSPMRSLCHLAPRSLQTLLPQREAKCTPDHIPLQRLDLPSTAATCQQELQQSELSVWKKGPSESQELRGPKLQDWVLKERSPLSRSLGKLFCQCQPSALEKEAGTIYKALWAECFDFYLYCSDLNVTFHFSERYMKCSHLWWGRMHLTKNRPMQKKKSLRAHSVQGVPYGMWFEDFYWKLPILVYFPPVSCLGFCPVGIINFA